MSVWASSHSFVPAGMLQRNSPAVPVPVRWFFRKHSTKSLVDTQLKARLFVETELVTQVSAFREAGSDIRLKPGRSAAFAVLP